MTRKEAIANLNMISVAFVGPVTKEQRKLIDDTFEMAVQALLQQPCEDAISRQAVLDAVDKVCRGSVEYRVIYDRCEELIKAIPSADIDTLIERSERMSMTLVKADKMKLDLAFKALE